MTAILVGLCAALGLAVGSFLNVVIWRVPRSESVVSPPSACPSCGTPIAPRDNVPVLSWLLLSGRCRTCHGQISPRYPLVELGTGVLFALVAWEFGLGWDLPAFLYFAAISVALALIDIEVHRLPNSIVLPSYVVAAVLLGAAALLDGDPAALVRVAIGGACLYVFYFILALIYPGGMGFGDVKLAGVLGMYLTYLGWAQLLVGLFLGFFVGGVSGLVLVILRRAGRKSKIPYGPYMLVGAWLAVFGGDVIADTYLRFAGIR